MYMLLDVCCAAHEGVRVVYTGGIQLYILGFTAGAFLNISLCSVLPQLLQEERPSHSAAQMVALLLGTFTMASVAC